MGTSLIDETEITHRVMFFKFIVGEGRSPDQRHPAKVGGSTRGDLNPTEKFFQNT